MIKANRKSECGQVITETLLCMLLICLVFFGLMQVFHMAVANMITNYAAWSAARSSIVGFDEQIVGRSARVASIGASGILTRSGSGEATGVDSDSLEAQFNLEKSRIPYYLSGELYFEYDHWNTMDEGLQNDGKKDDNTHLTIDIDNNDPEYSTVKVNFMRYPLLFFTGSTKDGRTGDSAGGAFFARGDHSDVESGEDGEGVTLYNYSSVYFE